MAYRIAGIDVHKKVVVVVVADAEDPETILEWRRYGTGHGALKELLQWLQGLEVQEAVMESTAQYWKPVWMELEPHLRLHLAQAQSNRAPQGRKSDLGDAKRLVRRFVCGELFLSFVPEPEQRGWRSLTRGRVQLVQEKVMLQNQVESLLEECRIKLSSVVSDLFGASGLRILRAMASGKSDPHQLAALGDERLRCSREVLMDAVTGSMSELQRTILRQHLERIDILNRHIEELSRECATQMKGNEDVMMRLITIPGVGAFAAQEIVAEIGPMASVFPSSKQLASWVGVCPGSQESAGENASGRCAKGNRFLRRVLCQSAQAAVRTKDCYLQTLFRRLVVRLGYIKAIWAIAHRICKIIWNILRQGQSYIEKGEAVNPKAVQRCINHHLKALRKLGYVLPQLGSPTSAPTSTGTGA